MLETLDTNETLTLAQVIAEVGWPGRSSLVRILGEQEPPVLLGVVAGPRPGYPRASLPVFRALRDAHLAGEVKPKTAAEFIRTYITGMPNSSEQSNTAISEQADSSLEAATSEQPKTWVSEQPHTPTPDLIAALAAALREALAPLAPVREDRLLTSAEAATILACRPRAVSRYVPPVRAGVYRLSDVMAYIARLSPTPRRTRSGSCRPGAAPDVASDVLLLRGEKT